MDEEEIQENLPPATVTWCEIGVVLALAFLPALGVSLFHITPGRHGFWETGFVRSLQSIQVFVPILYLMWRSGLSWEHYGLGKNRDLTGFGVFVGAVIAGLVLTPLISNKLYELTTPANEVVRKTSSILEVPPGVGGWIFLAFQLLLNSLAEEFAVRGFLTARLNDVTKRPALSVVVPAALFGLYHVYQGWAAAAGIAVGALFFGAMFLSTRRLWALVLAHTVINLTVYWMYANHR